MHNKFQKLSVFIFISETVLPTNVYHASLEMSSYSTSAHICCLQKWLRYCKLKIGVFISSMLPIFLTPFFYIISLNIHFV